MIYIEYNPYNERYFVRTPDNDWIALNVPAPGQAKNFQTQITQVSPTEILVLYEDQSGKVCKKSCLWENNGYKEFNY